MKTQRGFTWIEFAVALIALLGFGGWIANIVKIVGAISDPLTGMFIFRCVGVFVAPVGAVLGWF